MKVKEKYYNLLKSGQKTIELRLFDEKRQKIRIGDEIIFSNFDREDDTFSARVVHLYRASDFQSLCRQISPQKAGFETPEELVAVMQKFYPSADQEKYGVLGIEIKRKI